MLFVYHTVVKLSELAAVPAVRGAHQVTGDALQGVNVVAMAVRALGEAFLGVLVAAV
jgi:hypothetical protein